MIKNLTAIQNELKAPKGRFNSFGKYSYRSAEDIMTAVKPILYKYGCIMTISDDIIAVGDRIYVKATVTIKDADGNTETVSAFARESEEKKGMDGSQITGTASSYARKYAMSGIFLIDDTKDADTDEYRIQSENVSKSKLKTAEPTAEEPTYTREYLERHGSEKITTIQAQRLKDACESNVASGGKLSLENLLKACRKSKLSDVTISQYIALCSQLKIAC